MKPEKDALPSVLFLFPHAMLPICREVEAGAAPTERLYGVVELRRLGYRVSFDDHRFQNWLAPLRLKLRRFGLFLPDFRSITQIARHDVVVVKDDFSLSTNLIAKLFGTRVIYMDAMFNLPRRRWRKWLIKLAIRLSDHVIAYSQRQIAVWSESFDLPPGTFSFLPYAVDTSFYRPVEAASQTVPFVLAVGRDLGRDFDTLFAAMAGTGMRLKLVTFPYLLPAGARDSEFVEVHQRVSYSELFQMYADATVVVVPLKDAISYPSGIRAVFEAALLRKAVIATRTDVLEEYLDADSEVAYVPAARVDALRAKLIALSTDAPRRESMATRAWARVDAHYGVQRFAEGLAKMIGALRPARV